MAYEETRKVKGRTRYTGIFIGEVVLPPIMGKRTKVRERFKTRDEAERWEELVRLTGTVPNRIEQARRAEDGAPFSEIAKRLEEQGGPGGKWQRSRQRTRPGAPRNDSDERRRAVVREHFGDMPVKTITYTVAEDFVAALRKDRQCSNATINRYLSALSSYLAYAERRGDIERMPQLPWQTEHKKKQPHYSDATVEQVLEALRAKGYETEAVICDVLDRTGMRVGELLGLSPEQIGDDGYISLDDPEKIKNSLVRIVYVGHELARALRALVANRRLPRYQTLRRHVKAALESAGYGSARALHAFRHTAATRTVANEQDIQVAQHLLGHRSARTTAGYRAISPEVMRERAKKVSQRAGQKGGEVVEVDFTQPRQGIDDAKAS
jgi:integrase